MKFKDVKKGQLIQEKLLGGKGVYTLYLLVTSDKKKFKFKSGRIYGDPFFDIIETDYHIEDLRKATLTKSDMRASMKLIKNENLKRKIAEKWFVECL